MGLSKNILEQIVLIPANKIFKYKDLKIEKSNYASAAKVLERLQRKGIICKLSKGVFYRPQQTIFGEIKPYEDDILKSYLFENEKRVAYLTGNYLYNQMGLTTQVPRIWKIATFNKRIFINRGLLKITPVKSYISITDENYRDLGFLDALKDWNKIPDLDRSKGIIILKKYIQDRSPKEINQLISYSLNYPPRVVAFLGYLLDSLDSLIDLDKLENMLNPLTVYKLHLPVNPLTQKWHIK